MGSRRFPRELRDEILRIAAGYGARNVRVFGSFSRGEADEVELEPGRSLLDLGGSSMSWNAFLAAACPW